MRPFALLLVAGLLIGGCVSPDPEPVEAPNKYHHTFEFMWEQLQAELGQLGFVAGDPAFEDPLQTVCTTCHGDRSNTLVRRGCTTKWKKHLTEGRAAESVWEHVSIDLAGSTCGW